MMYPSELFELARSVGAFRAEGPQPASKTKDSAIPSEVSILRDLDSWKLLLLDATGFQSPRQPSS